ncbi:acetyltransferase, ribosomal protein N-acetylase [Desulfitobacterium dehalogenans ATCC 51507]|uniref:Acetyltransferase, ribosomal protein N-acetylase n=1 Tax=Desulfitobacterium dehalogenans (strain ATCC 51507 / DSM 9161 / JW/IU-DC1) TaxID=756499 RepID=I4A986_DESDJ|nr:acetyltransferase, ribosomal protein N-acetylase [Desulfitobacterium dehalogenans ATCC 51507]
MTEGLGHRENSHALTRHRKPSEHYEIVVINLWLGRKVEHVKSIQLKNGQLILIREAVKEDAQELVNYLHKIGGESDFLTFGSGELSISANDEESIIEESRNAKNKIMLLALVDNKVIGCLSFVNGARARTQHTGEFGLSVLKDYWGQGIGSAMLKELIRWAKDSNTIKKLNLRVRSDHAKAIELYKRFGFVQEGMITRELMISEKFYDFCCMGLCID